MSKVQRIYRELRKYMGKAEARYGAYKLMLINFERNPF